MESTQCLIKMEAEIVEVIAIEPFSIIAKWSDGRIRRNDYGQKIQEWKESKNVVYQKLAIWQNFMNITIRNGVLSWPGVRVEFNLGNVHLSEPFEMDPGVMMRDSEVVSTYLDEDIGLTLSKARKAANLTQEDLARRIGSTKQYISKVERGVVSPQVDTLQRIMAAMGRRILFA